MREEKVVKRQPLISQEKLLKVEGRLLNKEENLSHGIKGNDLKKFIDCKGNWNQQGKANQQFEAELFGLSQVENKADDSYFNESDLLNVEIVKRYGDSFISMPIQTIDNFANLDQWLLDNITMCRFERPTPVQKYSISLLSYKNNDGKYEYDLLAMSETGSGKTAAFLIPIIDRLLKKRKSGQQLNKVRVAKDGKNHTCIPNALIIAPTRELANQTFKEALKLAYRTPIVPALINGDHNYLEQVGNFKSGCDILIATPGRLIDMISQEHVNLKGCEFFVIDETDELLDKSFEEQTSAIVEQLPTEEKRTTGLFLYKINKLIIVMFSATYNDKVDKLVDKFLKDDYIKLTIARKTPPNLFEEVIFVEDINKSNVLKQVVKKIAKETPNYKIVIFSNKKNTCSSISSNLTQQGWKNLEFHADVPKREENLNKFRKGEVKILVASDAFQRGHDVKDITHIINYDVPKDYRIYVHRVGRTARAGKHGTAISFVNKTSNILLNIYEAAMERNNKNFIYSSDILQIIDQLIQEREKKKWENEIEKDVRREISRMRSSGRYFQQTGYIQNVENNNQNVEYYGWKMKLFKIIFSLTTTLLFVNGMKSGGGRGQRGSEEASTSTSQQPGEIIQETKIHPKVEENIDLYKTSTLFNIDNEIFNKLTILKNYNKQYMLKLNNSYSLQEMEKSVKICENEGKNAISELKKNVALNKAIAILCDFKSYAREKEANEERQWIESKGTWSKQGKRSKNEDEMYAINWENEVDDDSIVFDYSILDIKYNVFIQPLQNAYTIPALMMTSNDLLAVSNTGSGKTVAFLVPLIDSLLKRGKNSQLIQKPYYPIALILAPTKELAEQIYGEVLKLTYRTPIVPALVYGGTDNYPLQINKLKAGSDILVATPMRLIDMMGAGDINLENCYFVVLDEADRLLDNSFRDQTLQIINQLNKNRRTVMFSATNDRLDRNVDNILSPNYINLKITQSIPTNIIEEIVWVDELKKEEMLISKLYEVVQINDYKVVIFLNKKRKIDKLVPKLNKEGFECLAFHKDVGKNERKENFTKFKQGKVRILVASDGFGRGIDDRKITHIINYDVPESLFFYI
ncbi:hypothetical protein Mgra_00005111 [Meloidogyne graminicola]|uniref:RNA helicase n=1 Tax=Meloidogyne graminicola TaxID=189291 RepID=A0A8S9ZPQ4_9BILA|nr:hypothetical protein Mgra_00005111 [Meloidogyne graminicola]